MLLNIILINGLVYVVSLYSLMSCTVRAHHNINNKKTFTVMLHIKTSNTRFVVQIQ